MKAKARDRFFVLTQDEWHGLVDGYAKVACSPEPIPV
jgi:hypothetical protein